MHWMLFRLTTCIIAGAACFILSLFSYFTNRSKLVNKLFCSFNFFLGVWNFGDLSSISTFSHATSLLLCRLSFIAAALSVLSFFYLCVEVAKVERVSRKINILILLSTVFIIFISFTPLLVRDVDLTGWRVELPGVLFPCFLIYMIGILAFGLRVLFKSYKSATHERKYQLQYLFLAFVVAGIAVLFYVIFITNESFPPLFYVPETAYVGIVAYAILRYRLMGIKTFIRRAGLFSLIYGGLLIATIPLLMFLHHRLLGGTNLPVMGLGVEVLILSTILSLGPILYAAVIRQSSYFKEDTLAGLTHELKSPLAIIEGALDAMQQQKAVDLTGDHQKEYVEMMERNLSRLKLFVNDLVVVFGNKNYQSSLHRSDVAIEYLIDTAFKIHEDAAKKKSVSLIKIISADIERINCDSERIIQVLSNLISNALKFTQAGTIQIKIDRDHDTVLFSVTDTGAGIPKEDLSSIFDRFYKGQGKQKTTGTGVGLAIAKTWVEAHEGRIWAESEGEGKGTTVMFALPI